MAKRTAKRSAPRGKKKAKPASRKAAPKRSAKRQKAAKPARKRVARASSVKKAKPVRKRKATPRAKSPRLDRARRTLDEAGVPTPPSSLDMDRRGTAARSGRAEMLDNRRKHGKMNAVTAGDVDVDAEDAYFTGEEAPGGDNPTPDQDVVDEIGKALGVEYQPGEELEGSDKITKRDKHRWELDPASSEDYKGRK